MATKVSGLGDNFYIAGYDVSGATNSLGTISGSVAPLDYTDITQSAFARLGGQRDGVIDFVSYMDISSGGAHALFSSLPRTDVIANYYRGTAVGSPAAGMVAKQLDYDFTRAANSMLTAAVTLDGQGFGLEWGTQLTPGHRVDTTNTVGAFYDLGAEFSHGAQAYLQAFALTGTDAVVTIQHCATSGGSYTSLMAFASVGSVPSAQRISVSNSTTVHRYLKVVTTHVTGFTLFDFAVMVNVNQTAGVVF